MAADPQTILRAAAKARDKVPDLHRIAFDWRMSWLTKAHAHQIEPEGDWWTIWLMLAGRGAGKTRSAAEWIAGEAWDDPGSRSLVAAPTGADIRDTCFEGESGLLSVIPPKLVQEYNRSLAELILVNGSLIKGIPASEPSRFRGGQWHRVWGDETSSWADDQESLDMIMFAMRLGPRPRMVITTTPKPRQLIRSLVARAWTAEEQKDDKPRGKKDVALTRATTMANLANLAPTFREQVMSYEGTALFRQEALGELIDPEESGIIRRDWFRLWPAQKPLPVFEYLIMSLDTAFTEATVDSKTHDPDYSACTVWGGFQMDEPHKAQSVYDIPELEDDRPHNNWAQRRPESDVKSYVMLLDAWQDRLGLPDLIKRVRKELNCAYGGDEDVALVKPKFGAAKPRTSGRKVDIVLIEQKGSGISLRQSLEREGIVTWGYNPGRADKLSRLHIVSSVFARRQIWIPESDRKDRKGKPRSWVEPVLEQLCSYAGEGSLKHDDFVDSCTQSIRVMMDKGFLTNQSAAQAVQPQKKRLNPYDQ